MKTEKEIREKIDSLMIWAERFDDIDYLIDQGITVAEGEMEHEALCNQIDALLWVIGDESGNPI